VRQDWQLRRNRAAFPRAWVVHFARIRPPASDPDDRADLIRTLAFQNDPIWSDPSRPIFDPRAAALIETDDRDELKGFLVISTAGLIVISALVWSSRRDPAARPLVGA